MRGGARVNLDRVSVLEFSSIHLLETLLFEFVSQWTSTGFVLSFQEARLCWLDGGLPAGGGSAPPLIQQGPANAGRGLSDTITRAAIKYVGAAKRY